MYSILYISHLNSHPIVPRSLLAPKHPKVLCMTVLGQEGQEGPEAKNFHMDSWAHRPSPTGSSFHSNLSREHAKAVRFQLFWRRKKRIWKSKEEATHGISCNGFANLETVCDVFRIDRENCHFPIHGS